MILFREKTWNLSEAHVSSVPHQKRPSKFKADVITNFGPGASLFISRFFFKNNFPQSPLNRPWNYLLSPHIRFLNLFFTNFAPFFTNFSLFSISYLLSYLNLCNWDLVILCIDLLIFPEDVPQLVIVLVLVLVEYLKVDSLRAEIGECVVEADLVVSMLLRAEVNVPRQPLSLTQRPYIWQFVYRPNFAHLNLMTVGPVRLLELCNKGVAAWGEQLEVDVQLRGQLVPAINHLENESFFTGMKVF